MKDDRQVSECYVNIPKRNGPIGFGGGFGGSGVGALASIPSSTFNSSANFFFWSFCNFCDIIIRVSNNNVHSLGQCKM